MGHGHFNKDKLPATAEELIGDLSAAGWRELEAEHHGRTRILYKPRALPGTPSAMRVNISGDIGFYNYATLCMERPSPHFQKVSGHGILRDGVSHVTITERLYPAPAVYRAYEPQKSQLQAFWALANSHFPYANPDGRKFSRMQEEEQSYNHAEISADELRVLKGTLEAESQSLANAVTLLIQCQAWLCQNDARFSDYCPDFMPDNVMIRKSGKNSGTIVLSDPFSCDPRQTELYAPSPQDRIMEEAFGAAPANITRLFRFEM